MELVLILLACIFLVVGIALGVYFSKERVRRDLERHFRDIRTTES